MASRQYFRGFVLLVILMRNPVLSASTEATTGATDTGATDTGATVTGATVTGTTDTGATDASSMGTTDSTPVSTTDPSNNASDISCRQFTCNETACNTMFMNQTAVPCNANFSYCQLQRVAFMNYTMSCSANCLATCVNQTQYDCSMDCCNTTDCLSAPFQPVPTVPPTAAPTTTSTTTTTTVTSTTSGNNGKKCHKLTCTGEKCYTNEKEKKKETLCPIGQDYCQLKKEVKPGVITWQASCSGDCRMEKVCTSTSVDCTQECCNATKVASCLKLGSAAIPISAGSAHALLASVLLAWLLGSQFHPQ